MVDHEQTLRARILSGVGVSLILVCAVSCGAVPAAGAHPAAATSHEAETPPTIRIHDVGTDALGWSPMTAVGAADATIDYLIDTGGSLCTLAPAHATLLSHGTAGSLVDSNGERSILQGLAALLIVDGHPWTQVPVQVLGPYTRLTHGRELWKASVPTLGQSLLGERVVVIDGPGHALRFPVEMPPVAMIPFTSFGPGSHHLVVAGRRHGMPITIFLDTGCARSRIADQAPGTGDRLAIAGLEVDLDRYRSSVTHLDGDREMTVGNTVLQVTLGWDVLRDYLQVIDYPGRRWGWARTLP